MPQQLDSARWYAHVMLNLAKQKNNQYFIADAYDLLSSIDETTGDLMSCIDYSDSAKYVSRIMNDQLGVIYFATNMGSVYMKMGRYFEALQNFEEVKDIAERIKRLDREAAALNNIGAVYHFLGDDKTALDYFIRSYTIRKEHQLTEKLAYSLNNIGAVYSKYGNYNEALEYHEKALETAISQNDTYNYLIALINMGQDNHLLKQYTTSLDYYRKALEEADKQQDLTSKAHVMERMSAVYVEQGKVSQAEPLLLEAIRLSEQTGNKYDLAAFYHSLGVLYLHQLKYSNAAPLLIQALAVAKEINAGKIVMDAYKSLNEYYYLTGNPTEAYQYQLRYETAKDSAYQAESELKIANLKNRFELNQKLDELSISKLELSTEKQTSQNRLTALYMIGIAGGLLLLMLVYIFMLFRKIRRQNHVIRESEKRVNQLLEQEKELNQLKTQMISTVNHEFRTPMAIISSNTQMLRDLNDEMTPDMRNEALQYISSGVDNLLSMLKNFEMLDSKTILEFHPKPLDLHQLVQNLVNELQTLAAYQNRLRLTNLLTDGKVIMDGLLITHMVRNLLINALKFSDKQPVELRVELIPKKSIIFTVTDHGIGMSAKDVRKVFDNFYRGANATAIKGTGMGMSVVKRCVDMHSGTIEIQSQLNVGTTINVVLPFREVNT